MSDFAEIREAQIDVYTDNGWQGEDIPAVFSVTFDMPDRGVGYWGGLACELIHARFGSLNLTRDMLVQAMSEAEVRAIEARTADTLADDPDAGSEYDCDIASE